VSRKSSGRGATRSSILCTPSACGQERLKTLPRELMNKCCSTSSRLGRKQADERKGAMKYDVSVLSAAILPRNLLEQEDYLVAIDILRAKTARVLATIDEIAELQG